MTYVKDIKNAAAGFAFLMAAFAVSTNVNALSNDADGLRVSPVCDEFRYMESGLLKRHQLATGKKASNAKWDMEIYEDATTGAWSLLARDKNPASKLEESCILKSSKDSSYIEEKWYEKYFKATIK